MTPIVRSLGICDYQEVWDEMVQFTRNRNARTQDEVWLLQHHPVYTQGTSCQEEPESNDSTIPVIHSDRGGHITYHGPGQLIAYLLMDIKRLNTGPKSFVKLMEQIVINFLGEYGVTGQRVPGAPGVYIGEEKIAALGLRISRGCCYHGISINIDMDLSPYKWINPCGYPRLRVTQLKNHVHNVNLDQAQRKLKNQLSKKIRKI